MSDQYLGEIRLFAFQRTPIDWLPCNGQSLSVSTYQALFALIGATYGGDGRTTFALPNLNGRVPVGQGQNPTTVPPLSPRPIGQAAGADNVTLTISQVPAHTHQLQATTAGDSTGTLGPTVTFGADTSNKEMHYLFPVPSGLTPKELAETAVDTQGGSAPHLNIMPGLGLAYFICISNGIFPTQS